jgi:ribosome-associated translation inhibitor RaiA
MKIAVTERGHAFGRQTRAYAEYRVFSTLARFADVMREVEVTLTPFAVDGSTTRCRVVVTLEGGDCLRVSARGRHVYDAINRAARRISDDVRRHTNVVSHSHDDMQER